MFYRDSELANEGCTYIGSMPNADVWFSTLDELIIQLDENGHYACMPIFMARKVSSPMYRAAIALYDAYIESIQSRA